MNNIEKEEGLLKMKNTKKLIGTSKAYRIKVGSNYRIGAEIDLVLNSDNKEGKYFSLKRFLHRKDIYRKFPIKK